MGLELKKLQQSEVTSLWNNLAQFACGGGLFVQVLLLATTVALSGCSSAPTKPDYSKLTWPLPPDPPRIRFIAAYHSQSDLNETSQWKAALLGEDSKGYTLMKPYGVTATPDGRRIYVADSKAHAIVVIDQDKHVLEPLKTDTQGALYNPVEIRLDSRGRIYVTDSERNEILIFDQDGKTLMALGKKEEVGRPTGLALDESNNRMYVTDTTKHRILAYDLEGNFLFAFGERGSDPGQLNYPVNLVVDHQGRVLVTDTGNFRVQIYDAKGNYLKDFGEIGDSYGTFTRPKGIAVDSEDHIYVIDAAFNNFQIFNEDGHILLFVGAMGQDPGTFWLPTDIYIDPQDRIYVADSINQRVQVFQYIKEEKGGADESSTMQQQKQEAKAEHHDPGA